MNILTEDIPDFEQESEEVKLLIRRAIQVEKGNKLISMRKDETRSP